MIEELWNYILTPASKDARQSGALSESIAFELRGRRSAHLWHSHWETCQELVRKAILESQAQRVVLLGSGSLFEFPLDQLEKIKVLVCVDQVFPRSVRRLAKSQSLKPLGVLELHELNIAHPQKPLVDLVRSADLILSANLLSQIALTEIYRRHAGKEMTEKELFQLQASLQSEHWSLITTSGQPWLLWSDFKKEPGPETVQMKVNQRPVHEWRWQWSQELDLEMKAFRG